MKGILSYQKDRYGHGFAPYDKNARYAKAMRVAASIAFAVMLTAQLLLIILFSGEQLSDAGAYLRYAMECADNGWWYPSAARLHDAFVFGNGWVNLLALLFCFTRDIRAAYFVNLLFVQMILWSCVYILRKVFGRDTLCCWFVILFCLLNTMWSGLVLLYSDIMFTGLAFLGLALLYSDKKGADILGGGVLALANWVRPLGIAFLIGGILLLIYREKTVRNIMRLVLSYTALLLAIGSVSFASCGHFVYQATTSGVNLVMSANDDANGHYNITVFSEGKAAYLSPEERENMTFQDYDAFYRAVSVDWILSHPYAYLSQIPIKLVYLYSTETYFSGGWFNNEDARGGVEMIHKIVDTMRGESSEAWRFGDFMVILDELWYLMIVVLFAAGIVLAVRNMQWRFMLPLWSVVFLGTGMTLLVVCESRYHFPYLPIMMISAAFALEHLFSGDKRFPVREKGENI